MKRRQALSSVGALAGGAFILPQFLVGCDPGPYKYELFQWGDTELLNELAETILPATENVPGAKAANVGDFVQLMVTDCYAPKEQTAFLTGYQQFKLDLEKKYGKHFIDLDSQKKAEVLTELEAEAKAYESTRKRGEAGHFYSMAKGTILFGYFTSEPGATKALNYVPVPGEQKGIIPYNGEKAWAL